MSTVLTDVLVWDTAAGRPTGPVDVRIEGNRIAEVAAQARARAEAGARIFAGGGSHLVVPGLINGHFHSPANHLGGSLPSLPLEMFMLYESPAAEELRPTPREAYLRTLLGVIEMLRGGTTAVQDDAFLMPAPDAATIDAVMAAYRDAGIRASVALDQPELPEVDKLPFLTDLLDGAPADIAVTLRQPGPMPAHELLEHYRHLFSAWHGAANGRLTAAVSVSAPQRVTPDYFAALDGLSAEHDVPLFAHMLETRTQRALAMQHPRFGGRSLVRYTADLGLLNARTNVIHAVWVDDDDLDLIADAGATVLHNPVSNLRLGSGVMPWRAMRERSIPVGLGVDEAICNDAVDMWSVVRAAGLVHNLTDPDPARWPQACEVLDCLWSGGAAALRRSADLGSVEPGRLADLAVLDLHGAAFSTFSDVAGQLVYRAAERDVVLTMVDGQVVAENGKLTTVDEGAVLAELRETYDGKRAALERAHADAGRYLPYYRDIVARAAATDVGMARRVGP
jgi:5-methylthioadenosine/S-adenosylhomocysteine deaminase